MIRSLTAALFAVVGFSVDASGQEPAPATSPTSVTATSTPSPVTPATGANVQDFGSVDLEMAIVTDFSQLDLAELLDAKVETASRKSENISKAPAIIEVLTRQQLYDLGVQDLYSALTFLPGIEVEETFLGYPVFTFRGQQQEQYNGKILFLVNGHPSFESVNSSFYFEQIPIEAIERIEVIRGPGSVLYGTNAFAGVINVITRSSKEDGVQVDGRLTGGSFRTLNGGAGAFGRRGDLAWALFTGGQTTKGYRYEVRPSQNEDCVLPPAEQPVPADCRRNPSLAFDMWHNYANVFADLQYKGIRLQGGAMRMDKNKYGVIPIARFHAPNEFEHYWGDLSFRHEWEKVSLTVRGGADSSYRVWHFGKFPLPRFLETYAENDSILYRAEATLSYAPIEPVRIDVGSSFEYSTANYYDVRTTDGSLHPLSPQFDRIPAQTAVAGYAQASWSVIPELTILAGNRTTWFQSDRLETRLNPKGGSPLQNMVTDDPVVLNSPRGGIVYAPIDELAFKALYGTAFRQPTHFETSAVFKQAIGTTENLKPETIRTAEMGIDSRPIDRLSLRLNGYYSLTDRLIKRRPPTTPEIALFGPSSAVFDNSPGERLVGSELSVKAVVNEQLNLFANGAYKLAKVRETGEVVTDVSRFSGSSGLSYQPASWLAFKPNAQYFGKRGAAGAYWLLNCVIDVPVSDNIVISAIGLNLTDRQYLYPEHVRKVVETMPGGPGRAFYGRILANF